MFFSSVLISSSACYMVFLETCTDSTENILRRNMITTKPRYTVEIAFLLPGSSHSSLSLCDHFIPPLIHTHSLSLSIPHSHTLSLSLHPSPHTHFLSLFIPPLTHTLSLSSSLPSCTHSLSLHPSHTLSLFIPPLIHPLSHSLSSSLIHSLSLCRFDQLRSTTLVHRATLR